MALDTGVLPPLPLLLQPDGLPANLVLNFYPDDFPVNISQNLNILCLADNATFALSVSFMDESLSGKMLLK